ncbi:MAG: sigma 54-interacting transcriptional regulator [Deltaproteobacteria bacterium]|nr:sigma 54-interacting transcriptional regulator [Deltaproteobacteria bacterium]MCW5802487.1 sigma 54-interacting transcriptional regulator [Deltaproteobacteria bacterium]
METKRPDRSTRGELVLCVATPDGTSKSFRFAGSETLIAGRDAAAPVVVPDDSVSRRHAEFRAEPLGVRDLGSTNGTRVQGVGVGGDWVGLEIGNVVELGDAVIFVRSTRSLSEETVIPQKRTERHGEAATHERVVVDPAMTRLYALVDLVGPSKISVLILGETGSGKEVVARALHAASTRRDQHMLTLNCAAIAPSLLESELFGFEKGAFTGAAAAKPGLFESATGGTVFLDEVGEMPLETQAKLLRVLESGEVLRIGALKSTRVDVRFVAATHRDLATLAEQGRFRVDLLYRISGVTLAVPPLRERREDLLALAQFFLARVRTHGKAEFTEAALEALRRHSWPGNVRELKSTIERAELLSRGGVIDAGHLTFGVGVALGGTSGLLSAVPTERSGPALPAATEPSDTSPRHQALSDEMSALERDRILAALEACGGNQSRAAKSLGISRATLIRRLEAYGVPRPRK